MAAVARVKAKKSGKPLVRVIAQGGDGGTTDIGFGCLSGMFERNDYVLYICYDNEGYMNTGVQRSSATPPAVRTATTQIVGKHPGNAFGQGKDVPLIAMAHGIPYVATATIADLRDLERKVAKAMTFHGARYIHILVPCPLGWGAKSADTVKLARLAVETGLFPVFESEYGEITKVTKIRQLQPVENYMKLQKPLRSPPSDRRETPMRLLVFRQSLKEISEDSAFSAKKNLKSFRRLSRLTNEPTKFKDLIP